MSEATVNRIIQETADLLKSEGYFEATITPKYDFREPTQLVDVTLNANPGVKARITNIRIQGGEQTFPPTELLDALDLKSGDDFSSAELDRGVARVQSKFTNLGFLNTRVNVDQPYSKATHTADLNVTVDVKGLSAEAPPVIATRPEFMRRMKDMAAISGPMGSFYANMPDEVTLTVNGNHPIYQALLKENDATKKEKQIRTLADLALLSQGLLKGNDLTNFINRNVELMQQADKSAVGTEA